MSKFTDTLPEVEINFPKEPSSDFFFKINGRKVEGTCGITIKSPLDSGTPYPTVTVTFYAKNVKGKIQGLVMQKPYIAKE